MNHAVAITVITAGEAYIVKRLQAKGVHIYPVSDAFPMKERIRRAIIDSKCDHVILGTNPATRKVDTFLQAYERLYGEPLEPKSHEGKTTCSR
jgi:hypothetical protein